MSGATPGSNPAPERPVALVTGGTRGIGLGIAQSLAADGWDLVLCGVRSEEEVFDALNEVRTAGASVTYVIADISQPGDRARLVATVAGRFGGLDALVNNAGRAPRVRADLLEATEESFDGDPDQPAGPVLPHAAPGAADAGSPA